MKTSGNVYQSECGNAHDCVHNIFVYKIMDGIAFSVFVSSSYTDPR